MELTTLVINQIIIMFAIILIGIICSKAKLITTDGKKSISSIVLMLVNPVIIILAYQTEFNKKLFTGLLYSLLFSVISFAIAIAIGTILVKKKNNPDFSIECYSVIYSNCSFIGIPLINAIFGAEGVFYLTAYLTLFNLLFWTHGIMLIKGEFNKKSAVEALTSPSIIAVVVGLAFFLLKIKIPLLPTQILGYIGDLNMPLAMLVAGATIAEAKLSKALLNPRIYVVCFLKLIIVPLVALFTLKLLPGNSIAMMTVVIATACPTGATGTLIAVKYGKNAAYSSEIFGISTILSAFTLPIFVLLMS